ncbi:hypothetical protein G9C98_000068 [Cotesia typhae]|uniref:PX domain-containing protein n=1 Tax=Cotesia typhae TaxID=2053667 RepID=A0A8J5UTW0_9HYME|nr:hypothetical protein G9C98_000068 [Cotesia typhae]
MGQSGLFPAAYVQVIEPTGATTSATVSSLSSVQQSFGDYWDDDWDDDSEVGQTPAYNPQQQPQQYSNLDDISGPISNNFISPPAAHALPALPEKTVSNVPKKNNKFSTLIKSGEEGFLMGTKVLPIPEDEKIFVQETEDGRCYWLPTGEEYKCVVTSPKKGSKLKGLKSFIVYQLTPTYCFIATPPLPDKQISGRYDEQFIEHRRTQLQEFVDYVCRHPILSRSRVWQHFIMCTDEKRWKAGKRQAEKDELLGVNYFNAIQCSDMAVDAIKVDIKIDSLSRFISGLDPVVKNFMAMSTDQGKKYQNLYKRELQKIGQSFIALGHALESDCPGRSTLTNALRRTGEVYNDIGRLYEEQPRLDWEPLADKFHIYRGVINNFPDVISIHKSAVQKKKDCERLVTEHKMEPQELRELSRRTDVIARSLMAEETHFQSEIDVHVNQSMKNHLVEQIGFYQKIVSKLEEALAAYNA